MSLFLSLSLSGAHILQKMNGCDWDDETGEVVGYNQFGYDGEDFIVLDLQTLTWTAPKQQAFFTKLRWDTDKARLDDNKNYYINICPDRLKKYVHYARSFMQRTGRITRPDVPLCMDSVFLRHWIIPMKIISWHILVSWYRLICVCPSLQSVPQCLSSRRLPPLQSAATLQVSTPTESWCSGGKMERRFMRTWTSERSSPTTMDPSRWVLSWTCYQSHLKTGGGTTVCFISLVWWTTSSPDWTKQWSGPTGVRLVYTCIFVYLFATDSCNIWWTVRPLQLGTLWFVVGVLTRQLQVQSFWYVTIWLQWLAVIFQVMVYYITSNKS